MKKTKSKNKNAKAELDQEELTQQTVEETSEEKAEVEERNLEAELAELNDKHLRLFSEFDNFRKRTARERLELIQSASKDLIADLLPVLDDFDRASASMDDNSDIESVKEGVTLVHNKMVNLLGQKGLKPFEAKGESFDADFHEAVTRFPAPSEDLKGKVVEVIEKGYMLNDKVLRYAKVVVGE